MTVSRAMALFGTEEPVDETPILRAGPLSCTLDSGNLRYITIGETEAIRAISMIVRNRSWGTFTPTITGLTIDRQSDRFKVRYHATCSDGVQSLAYDAQIVGRVDGSLDFSVAGEASTDFETCRAGFVVLHGIEGIVGQPVIVEHTDGTLEESRFPALIDPVQPFLDIRALTHEIMAGVRVTCRMEGDAYETEDQRNWMDASFKTYIRPLSRPWPYTLSGGDRLDLKVGLSVAGDLGAVGSATGGDPTVVTIGTEVIGRMPKLGLVVPADQALAALDQADRLRAGRFPVLVFSLLDGVTPTSLDEVVRRLEAFSELDTNAEHLLEAVLPCRDADGVPTDDPHILQRDLDLLAEALRRSGVRFGRIALSPSCDLKSTPPGGNWPKAPSFEVLVSAARAAFPGIEIGGGFFGSFTELNRKRPPVGLFDFVGHAILPTVHAGDDVSVGEGLEALPSILASARAIIGGRTPYVVYPTALSMRHNPYGPAPIENPRLVRQAMGRVDPRDRGLFAAAWYAGLIAHAARDAVDTLCLAAATGPSGMMQAGQSPTTNKELSYWPSWHVLAGLAPLTGAEVLASESSDARAVQVLAVAIDGRREIWLTNLTATRQQVRIDPLPPGNARASLLDAGGFAPACRDASWLDQAARPFDAGLVDLDAYAIVRIRISD